MFTGLIDDVGTIEEVGVTPAGLELHVSCSYDGLVDGESIAVNGACLTVRQRMAGGFTAAAVQTTLERTTIADWDVGHRVNLERALRLGDRLGGHLVQGHVDGVGVVQTVEQAGGARLIDVAIPAELASLLVPHGSIAVDGVSLTVNAIPGEAVVQISVIEYTLRHTALGLLVAGDRVHVEADIIGKFVARLVNPYLGSAGR